MNFEIAVQLLELVVSLVQGQMKGPTRSNAAIALILSQIVALAARAYHNDFGHPIDPSLIKPEPAN